MIIRKARRKDIFEASMLVSKTFEKFCSNEGNKKGIRDYISRHDPRKNFEKIKDDFLRYKIFLIVEDKGKIIGVARGSELRIGNLFVDGKYHKKGVAKKLMKKFEQIAKKRGSDKIKVRASIYATQFYQKIGYKKTTGVRRMHGIKIQPMRKNLK